MAFPRRLTLLLAVFGLLLGVVWLRVFSLQVLSREQWLRTARDMRHPGVRVDAPRGPILDARGRVLVQDEAALGLSFVADDWEKRLRLRCRDCGAVHARHARARARPCSCRAPVDRLEALPEEDLSPLEAALGLDRGVLARFARERVRALEEKVARLARQTVDRLDLDEFRAEDVRRALRDDHFRREQGVRENDLDAAWRPTVADLPPEAVRLLELDAALRYRGFSARASLARRPAHRALLGQCLGRTTRPSREDLDRLGRAISQTTPLGRSGVEGYYDDCLRGTPGVRYERAGDADDEDAPTGSAPEPGATLRLSLDLDACIEAQRALDEVAIATGYAGEGLPSGGFVVLEARTGRVLAWAEAPRFDPYAGIAGPMTSEEADLLRARAPGDPVPDVETFDLAMRPSAEASRVSQIAVEPGSALKILTALYLLENGAPGALSCTGRAVHANDKPGCHHAHGALSFEEAMCVSCNRWFAWALTRFDLARTAYPPFSSALGLGRRTGVDVAREGRGIFRPESDWSLRHLAIGQGSVTATPLQMARLAAVVANGGRLVTPRIAAAVGPHETPVEAVETGISASTIAAVRRGMAAVVEREGGTARAAFADEPPLPGVSVFGKTGTAQVGSREFRAVPVEDGPWHHWFVGFSERGDEPIAFAMVLYARAEAAAGKTAARAVARWLRWWYGRGLER